MNYWDDLVAAVKKYNVPATFAEAATSMGLNSETSPGYGNLYLRFRTAFEMITRRCADDLYQKYSKVMASVDVFSQENCYAYLLEITFDVAPFPMYASADIGPNGGACTAGGPCGRLWMSQIDGNMLHVVYDLWGLGVNGTADLYVHTNADCASPGGRYGPTTTTTGHIASVKAGPDGKVIGLMKHTHVKLYGMYSVLNRSVVLSFSSGAVVGCSVFKEVTYPKGV
eukprot:NODE_921_length_1374_cov_164.897358_g699_i1.p1 GENE.NODE_921_length_1374_cov_164.897358_g699_i1~~NODE_921_length_1374_cov_164.897358_g699_i1.p1  ORF type:complete len:226 (-),score=52.61 NODE_921_length_1374_cov_164.897358_g699_i1:164-841(-)